MIEPNCLLFCFLFLYVGQSALDIWLERLNLTHSQRHAHKPPAGFEGFIDESKLGRTMDYVRAKTRLGILKKIVSDGILLAILLSGLLPSGSLVQ